MRILRLAAFLLPCIALVTILAPEALAQAGGGSSGFGGGGGGGGGSGGGGSGGGDGDSGFGSIVVFLLIALFALGVPSALVARVRLARRRRERAQRDERVTTASAEAAEDDPAFAADAVKSQAAALYADIQRAWSERDDAALERMLGHDLLVEWRRRLADFASKGWVNEVAIRRGPEVEYVGIVNREGAEEDRVTVTVTARLHSVVRTAGGDVLQRDVDSDRDGEIDVCEYWTLARSGGGWKLVSIEQEQEGAHHLDAPIVTAPWSDDARLGDETVVQLATADAAPAGTNVSELVSVAFEGPAREKALDLALADPRCAPGVLEVAARRAVQAWAEAVDGDDTALLEIATARAAQALLYADGGGADSRARIVVRGPQLLSLAITALHSDAPSPRMEVAARVRGRRYVEDRDTAAVIAGDKDKATEFSEHWTFALEDSATVPWRLVDGTTGSGRPA